MQSNSHASGYYTSGQQLAAAGKWTAAITAFRRAIEAQSDFPDAYHALRGALMDNCRLEKAVVEHQAAVERGADPAEILYWLGMVHLYLARPTDAEYFLREAVNLDPEMVLSSLELGKLSVRCGRAADAIEIYMQALQYKPDCAPLYDQLAHAQAACGLVSSAAVSDMRALEIASQASPKLSVPRDIDQDPAFRSSCGSEAGRAAIPIVFIHRDMHLDAVEATPLVYSLAQARRSNPGARVLLIGDGTNRYSFVEHELMLDYFDEAHHFGKVYKHIAQHVRYGYLLFCFQRWFVLREFMAANRIERCLHVDSDVMLHVSVAEEFERFGDFDLKISAHPDFGFSGHYCYVGNRSALDAFCDFLLDCYSRPAGNISTILHDMVWKKASGYITDMTALKAFASLRETRVDNLSQVTPIGVYDANINSSDGFLMRRGLKDLRWHNDIPYGQRKVTGEQIRFFALHFNGRAKPWMKNAFHHKPWSENGSI